MIRLLIFVMASATFGWLQSATAAVQIPQNSKYVTDGYVASSPFNEAFDQVLKPLGYGALESAGKATLENPVLWLNRVYLRKTGQRISSKGGLRIQGPIQFGVVYDGDVRGRYIAHIQDLENGDHVFFFDGLSEEAVKEIVAKLMRVTDKQASAGVSRAHRYASLASSSAAHAEEGVVPNRICANEPQTDKEKEETTGVLEGIKSCGLGGLKGIWDSTGGAAGSLLSMAGSTLSFAGEVLTDPMEAARKVGSGVSALWNFVSNFTTYMDAAADGFAALSGPDKAEILCETAATIGTGAVITAVSGSGGSPWLAARVATIMEKMATLGKLKSLKSVQAANGFAQKAKALSDKYDRFEGMRKDLMTAVKKSMETTAKALTDAEKAQAAAQKAYEGYAIGNKAKRLEDLGKQAAELPKLMEDRTKVGQAASNLAALRKAYGLDKNLDKFVRDLSRELGSFDRKVSAAGTDQRKLAALEAERVRLKGEVERAEALLRTSPHELIPPTKAGWPSDYDVKKEEDLKKTLDAARSQATKALEERNVAAKNLDNALKAKDPNELPKMAKRNQDRVFASIAACKITENIDAKSPTANKFEGGKAPQ